MQTPQRTLTQLMSAARAHAEHRDEIPADYGQQRSVFETDGDKVCYSEAFRALADKTQVHDRVVAAGNHRNRLTHSIEVSRIGRSLGIALGARMIAYHGLNAAPTGEAFWKADPGDIGACVSVACLAHDLGNPPFGHDGEDAIADFFKTTQIGRDAARDAGPDVGLELQSHEGNAQGFRMITRSLGWREGHGLNLSAASLAAFGKYPFTARPGRKKYGVHKADLPALDFAAQATGMIPAEDGYLRHPFAWLMEAADDVAYLVVDAEDSVNLGIVPVEHLCALFAPVVGNDEIDKAKSWDDVPRLLQYLRSRMIKALINGCVEVYPDLAKGIDKGSIPSTSHGSGILAHTRHAAAMKVLRDYSREKIYMTGANKIARTEFRAAMIAALGGLTEEIRECQRIGDERIDPKARPALSRLPHSIHKPQMPLENHLVFPWLLDQITLMSDRGVLDLARDHGLTQAEGST